MQYRLHLEIRYLNDRRELVVYYQGNMVYKETAGQLESYAPSLEWEQHIDALYSKAKKVIIKNKEHDEGEFKKLAKKRQGEFLEEMRKKWGL